VQLDEVRGVQEEDLHIGVGPMSPAQVHAIHGGSMKWIYGPFEIPAMHKWFTNVDVDVDGDGTVDVAYRVQLCSCNLIVKQTVARRGDKWCVTESLLSTNVGAITRPEECD
jgi:hypothetical protein